MLEGLTRLLTEYVRVPVLLSISLSPDTLLTGKVGMLLCFTAQTYHEVLARLGMIGLGGEVGRWANGGK